MYELEANYGERSLLATPYVLIPIYAYTLTPHPQLVLTGKVPASELQDPNSTALALVHHKGVLDSLRSFNDSEVRHRLDRYTKFIFTRHPLERLLSAYRSKFQTLSPKTVYYRTHYGNLIARRFRGTRAIKTAPPAPVDDVTFPELVRLVVEARGAGGIDQHWKPISSLCHPLAVAYDFVGRYERLEEDANRLLR